MVKKASADQAHIFALYSEHISHIQGNVLSLRSDEPSAHRIQHVLRLVRGDTVILFDRKQHLVAEISAIGSREVVLACQKPVVNTAYSPVITCLLPILKREAFDEALYALTEAGVSAIQLITTHKMHRSTMPPQDRMERVIIAAAEQSKNFALPIVYEPRELSEALADLGSKTLVVCDPAGEPLSMTLARLESIKSDHIVVVIGPEAGLTGEEFLILRSKNAIFTALTPTILRAQQAAFLSVGALRSVLKS